MRKLTAVIKKIQTQQSLNLVTFEIESAHVLKMISLDLEEEVQVGRNVVLNVKPTSVAIGKNVSGELSYANKIEAIVTQVHCKELLCSILLSFANMELEAIITKESAQRMDLRTNDKVVAFIKANEISISEVIQ